MSVICIFICHKAMAHSNHKGVMCHYLREMVTTGKCFAISGKGLLWLPVCFTACQNPSEKGSALIRKEFAMGAYISLWEQILSL